MNPGILTVQMGKQRSEAGPPPKSPSKGGEEVRGLLALTMPAF